MNKFFTLVFLLAAASAANADSITKAKAIQIAEQFMCNNGMNKSGAKGMIKARAKGQMQSAKTDVAESTEGHYIVNNGNGFVVVASDDAVAQVVLGYSTSQNFDPNNIPVGMKDFLNAYDQQMIQAKQSGFRTETTATNRENIQYDTPLWDQSAPYNALCPMDENANTRSLTGCAATAMAEIMYYHHCPSAINWDVMDFTYTENSSESSCALVAELMKNLGESLNMNYSANVSIALAEDIPAALVKYGFSEDAIYLNRYMFNSDEWEQMVYDNLQAYGPLEYNGSSDSGHAFVCDGYRDGYFHFNWGWGGMGNDAYFTLSSLTPSEAGNGGNLLNDFTGTQSAVFNIHPANDGKTYTVKAGNPVSPVDEEKHFTVLDVKCQDEMSALGCFDIDVTVQNPYDERLTRDFSIMLVDAETLQPVVMNNSALMINSFADALAGQTVTVHAKFYPHNVPAGKYIIASGDCFGNELFIKKVAITTCEMTFEPTVQITMNNATVVNVSLDGYDGTKKLLAQIFNENGDIVAKGQVDINGSDMSIPMDVAEALVAGKKYTIQVIAGENNNNAVLKCGNKEKFEITMPMTNGINEIQNNMQKASTMKVAVNGKVYIVKNGQIFDQTGKQIPAASEVDGLMNLLNK